MNAAFTASQIASVLGEKRQNVQWVVRDVPANTKIMVNGSLANAWTIASLPPSLKEKLNKTSLLRHCRDAEDLLSSPPKEWQPAVPLEELHRDCIDAAMKLQRALAPSVARKIDPQLSNPEFERRGVKDYAREFGHAITDRYFRKLFKRTLDRDAGAGNFLRLEIYLPGSLKRKSGPSRILSIASDEDFRELHELISSFANRAEPSSAERTLLWLRSFDAFQGLIDEGRPAKKLRLQLLAFLWKHAPWLSKSANALREKFNDKFARWCKGEGSADSLVDGREKRLGISTATPYDSESLDKITWHAVANCGGRVSQAVRELVAEDGLDPQILRCFMRKPASKSYVPTRLRDAVSNDVAALLPIHQGPRAADKFLPSLDLKYDGVFSMQCVQADDFTMPVYFYVPDGQGWYRLTRGQVLLAIDWRSICVLGFCLYPEGQYNSGLIRTLFTRVFDEHGLTKILYLERGIWKISRLITGNAQAAKAVESGLPFSMAEVETGLRQFRIDFKHARRARSKPVERVGGLLQDLMEGEPGYCGRMEMKDCPEITTRNKRLVESRKSHPADLGFYSAEQWEARLEEICAQYNRTEQDGKRITGLSPDEAFGRYWNHSDPPTRFAPEHRYLLAHHKIPLEVGSDKTIKFKVRGETFKYFDAQTGSRPGAKLIAWFNPEAPEVCTFTDHKMRNAFTVARHSPVNGLFADDNFEAETAKAHAAAAPSKARYRVLKAKFKASFRSTIAGRSTEELGQQITQQTEAIQTQQRERNKRVSTIRNQARKLDIPAALLNDDEQTRQGLDLMEAARRDNAQAATSKIYHLKTSAGGHRAYVVYLVERLTEFRKAGKSFGQNLTGAITAHTTQKIASAQLGCDLYDETRFGEVCAHLKEKINATILGQRNTAKGVSNYHNFDDHAAAQPEATL